MGSSRILAVGLHEKMIRNFHHKKCGNNIVPAFFLCYDKKVNQENKDDGIAARHVQQINRDAGAFLKRVQEELFL